MQLVIIGNKGNMGQRYEAICRWLDWPYGGFDCDDEYVAERGDTHILIATPTKEHAQTIKKVRDVWPDLPILCEKPLTDSAVALERTPLTNVYLVNNWFFAMDCEVSGFVDLVEYDCYNTGSDGLFLDCIQLFMFAKTVKIQKNSPLFYAGLGTTLFIERIDIEKSYIWMLQDFVEDGRHRLPAAVTVPLHRWLFAINGALRLRGIDPVADVVSYCSETHQVGLRNGEFLRLDDLEISPSWSRPSI